ncbi:Hypothetical protein LOCK908_2108 [Lacticaseibacillus rhamnosus LOCK908]|nr:Hypothetical protein LOCK900_1993 [Lacticaseibacillus rhamnosus LOCK900]AGP74730.1 Hypothetical protein LOCK908_2108 [Lacticaseibacillus rhamnosus LOCK908]EHJ27408.1 hypothetical protein HMPREF0541_02533 [Lacticaseibacillus rhamnosus ATCC 21052]
MVYLELFLNDREKQTGNDGFVGVLFCWSYESSLPIDEEE